MLVRQQLEAAARGSSSKRIDSASATSRRAGRRHTGTQAIHRSGTTCLRCPWPIRAARYWVVSEIPPRTAILCPSRAHSFGSKTTDWPITGMCTRRLRRHGVEVATSVVFSSFFLFFSPPSHLSWLSARRPSSTSSPAFLVPVPSCPPRLLDAHTKKSKTS